MNGSQDEHNERKSVYTYRMAVSAHKVPVVTQESVLFIVELHVFII